MNHELYAEAKAMLGLVRQGETIAAVRALIGSENFYRRKVLAYFDRLMPSILKSKIYRGRRLSPAAKEWIQDRLRGGATYGALRREFGVTGRTCLRLRRKMGDFSDRTSRNHRKLKLSQEQIAQAIHRLKTERWRDVANEFQVTIRTLMVNTGFRKRALRSKRPT